MPAIGSEFQSNKYEEEPHNQDKIEEQSDYTDLPQQLVTSPSQLTNSFPKNGILDTFMQQQDKSVQAGSNQRDISSRNFPLLEENQEK